MLKKKKKNELTLKTKTNQLNLLNFHVFFLSILQILYQFYSTLYIQEQSIQLKV